MSAQISVLMAERNDGGGKNDAIRKSYQNLGTLRTAQNLIKHRGWRGLYSGFHLHLREHRISQMSGHSLTQHSPRLNRHRHLLCNIRKYKANPRKRARHISHTSPRRRDSWRHVWACELGMRKSHHPLPFNPHATHAKLSTCRSSQSTLPNPSTNATV